MSFLTIGPASGLGGFFEDAGETFAAGWGPFSSLTAREERKAKKDAAKSRLRAKAQSFEQQRVLTRDEAEAKAMEELRVQVQQRLAQMEQEADLATQTILKVRQVSATPILRGDEILEELGKVLSDMEKAAISIQAGTVVDTATFDTDALAGAYADAQAGMLAMRSVTARAQSVLKTLKERIKTLEEEKIRLEFAQAEAQTRAAAAEREARQLEDQRRREAANREREDALRARRDLMGKILQVDRQIAMERTRLSELKVELANVRFQKSEREARAAAGLGVGW
jgi:predicted  nucleic acid-binding Zn-ribbon protein